MKKTFRLRLSVGQRLQGYFGSQFGESIMPLLSKHAETRRVGGSRRV